MTMRSFHRTSGSPFGIVPMQILGTSTTSSDSIFGGIGDGFNSVFSFPGKVLDTFGGLGHDLIQAPSQLAGAVGSTITGVAAEAGGAIGNVAGAASDLLSSPVLLIGGAAVLLILLSR
jgi:hypothetical protein